MSDAQTLSLPIQDGYVSNTPSFSEPLISMRPTDDLQYRIRNTAGKLPITMKYRADMENQAFNTTESDVDDGSQCVSDLYPDCTT